MDLLFLFSILVLAAIFPHLSWKKSQEHFIREMGIAAGISTFVVAVLIAFPVILGADARWGNGFFFLDAFGAFLALIIAFIYGSASLVSYRYLGHEYEEKIISFGQMRLYYTLLPLFILAMLGAVFSDNIGMLWVTIEATTLATTLLVAFYKKEGALEAAWKYIILCSTGISLGLLGILMISFAAVSSGALSADESLSLAKLRAHAGEFSPEILKWAFAFIFVGFGSKVGFFPLHAWLPDAHSRTPAPISGLLSGVLLNVAMFAILRLKGVTDLSLGNSGWTNNFFLIFGGISILFPAFIFLIQKSYKRFLAYSSIKHMGFIAFALGVGGAVPAMLHLAGHALVKSALFFLAGEMLIRFKTTHSEDITQALKKVPFTGVLFITAILALLAVPPSGLFMSEFFVLMAGIKSHPFITLGVLIGLTLVFVGMIRHTLMMFLVEPDESSASDGKPVHKEKWNIVHTVVVAHLVLVVCLGAGFLTETGQSIVKNMIQPLIF